MPEVLPYKRTGLAQGIEGIGSIIALILGAKNASDQFAEAKRMREISGQPLGQVLGYRSEEVPNAGPVVTPGMPAMRPMTAANPLNVSQVLDPQRASLTSFPEAGDALQPFLRTSVGKLRTTSNSVGSDFLQKILGIGADREADLFKTLAALKVASIKGKAEKEFSADQPLSEFATTQFLAKAMNIKADEVKRLQDRGTLPKNISTRDAQALSPEGAMAALLRNALFGVGAAAGGDDNGEADSFVKDILKKPR